GTVGRARDRRGAMGSRGRVAGSRRRVERVPARSGDRRSARDAGGDLGDRRSNDVRAGSRGRRRRGVGADRRGARGAGGPALGRRSDGRAARRTARPLEAVAAYGVATSTRKPENRHGPAAPVAATCWLPKPSRMVVAAAFSATQLPSSGPSRRSKKAALP